MVVRNSSDFANLGSDMEKREVLRKLDPLVNSLERHTLESVSCVIGHRENLSQHDVAGLDDLLSKYGDQIN